MSDTVTVSWLPHGSPLPPGWSYAPHEASHHTRYCNLIIAERDSARGEKDDLTRKVDTP